MTASIKKWPFQDNPQIIIKDIADIAELPNYPGQIAAVTNGWVDGQVAAVLRGGSNARSVLDVMVQAGIKEAHIYHLEEKLPQLEEVFLSSVVAPAHTLFDNVNITWRREATIFDLIKSIGSHYNMLFFGAPLAQSEIDPLYKQLRQVYEGSITLVRGPVQDIDFDQGDAIYRWVRERTYEAADFSLPSVLRACKKNLGVKIAIILPSLNEEKTVGNVIQTALEVKDAGVIDDIILIDSNSTDNTVAIAQSHGIPVYQHAEIVPEQGSYQGKGEAMYKSAYVTDADILAWVDTDIETITPRFFYGLLGPMLTHPEIKFSKGYFSRPVRVEATGLELGGGRVTEILARPWINTFSPELSGYIQPLAGTVAIYRDSLLKMRIPANYGVEMAMLIQAVEQTNLWSTCQVNLGEVIHKSKGVIGLSEMAFQIIQVMAELKGFHGEQPLPTILRRVYSAHGDFKIDAKRFSTVWRNYGN
ncbi:Glucosyl-3-phosphoglycerate synthase [Sporomusa ovata DSM 2662]|uniref:Glucosyl-3-phosphoglycerate synthase n=1 Tax=Sporomusa ovata TaxID=2378 RepID=A0A0U1KX43_9FIRM|nr:glucosyl-3-phosphoglycerate synthase [Sporomusa ovata]EQB28352.1 glucosyl-3-phosphoglycerate synthase [Sporomusa ovata DSM 2662]CQR71991.1 Glycosyltransferase involved in cell wall biogenesis [Sporomusa ovata]